MHHDILELGSVSVLITQQVTCPQRGQFIGSTTACRASAEDFDALRDTVH